MLSAIEENRVIESLTGAFTRSPKQLNSRHETDAEIVRLHDGCTLAITTDSIAEEIAAGLYSDPYLVGWMAVMVNLSDLAAVGSEPLGLVLSEILTESCTEEFLSRMHEGIRDACHACNTYILGGDTNYGDRLILTATAIGHCPAGKFLSRTGCKPGDLICVSNRVGCGNAYAALALRAAQLSSTNNTANRISANYRPLARLKQGQILRGLATSCMDTSDGVIAALDQMMRLNRVGFSFTLNWTEGLDPWSRRVAHESGIPEWLLLAGQHGEFELLFTIPPQNWKELTRQTEGDEFRPIPLGKVISSPAITIPFNKKTIQLDTARIRNCAAETRGQPQRYLQELLTIDREIMKGAVSNACD